VRECSFVEENNADKAIKALTKALAPKAKVKRDGTITTLPAADIVPGDVVILQFGNIVPADVKLLGPEGEDDQPLQVPPM
jgi:P-type E1-E2 ATPase